MCIVFSNSFELFGNSKNINICGRNYNDVNSISSKDFIDEDGKRKIVKYIDTKNSNHVAYLENNKIVRTTEHYLKPKQMELGGKTYNNIVSKLTIPGKYDTYEIFTPQGYHNRIRVREKTGSVLDIGELKKKVVKRKMNIPFRKAMSVVKSFLLL